MVLFSKENLWRNSGGVITTLLAQYLFPIQDASSHRQSRQMESISQLAPADRMMGGLIDQIKWTIEWRNRVTDPATLPFSRGMRL